MKTNYRHRKTSVSMVNYHLVFCPRYRRKIFLIEGLEARFKELVIQICERNDFELLAMECDKDHCHIFVNVRARSLKITPRASCGGSSRSLLLQGRYGRAAILRPPLAMSALRSLSNMYSTKRTTGKEGPA